MAKSTVLLRVPNSGRPRGNSTWYNHLYDTRIVVDPYEMACGYDAMVLDTAALGILIRLMPYLASAPVEKNLILLARHARVHIATFKKWWPQIERLCDTDSEGRVMLRPLPWLFLQRISGSRQNLRRLLDRLVAYWGNACVYCGEEAGELEIEHIVPLDRGGTDELTNLTLACWACNNKKRTQTAAEFGFPHIHEMAARIQ